MRHYAAYQVANFSHVNLGGPSRLRNEGSSGFIMAHNRSHTKFFLCFRPAQWYCVRCRTFDKRYSNDQRQPTKTKLELGQSRIQMVLRVPAADTPNQATQIVCYALIEPCAY